MEREEEKMKAGDCLLPLRDVALRLACDVRTVWRLISTGKLPQPVKVGKQSALFASDLETYLDRLKQERDDPNKEQRQ
jgi:predicted DNA-binding transcriptional regulator AlpA